MDFTDRVALVTGAARRVGRAIALELARAGCHVAVHYHRSADEAHDVVDQIEKLGRRAVSLSLDLADPASAGKLVDDVERSLGGLDVLVNNASVFERDPATQADDAFRRRIFQINALTPAALIERAAGLLSSSHSGRVVNLGDISADRPWCRYTTYCASKAALLAMTRAYARQLAPDVTVNAVSPGIAAFPEHYTRQQRDALIEQVPLKRAGSCEEVARVVRFLIEHGDYITGQDICIDGGRSIEP